MDAEEPLAEDVNGAAPRGNEPPADGPRPLELSKLKEMTIHQLTAAAVEAGLQDAAGSKKHDLIFRMLHAEALRNGLVFAEGVLEVMPDGHGFLRAPESSYLAGPDDIYVSPSQIRRFDLRTGDTVSGQVRPPREGERYFASSRSKPSTSTRRRRRRTRSCSTTSRRSTRTSACASRRPRTT